MQTDAYGKRVIPEDSAAADVPRSTHLWTYLCERHPGHTRCTVCTSEREGATLPLTLRALIDANMARVQRWHALDAWSALEWAGAMAGEVGEACNAAKKLKRVEDAIANINAGDRALTTREDAARAIGMEVADTFIYGVLLCARVGVDLEQCLRDAFNAKSAEYGFPERL